MNDTFIEKWWPVPILIHRVMHKKLANIQNEIAAALPSVMEKDLTNPWKDGVKTDYKYGKFSRKEKGFLHEYNCSTLIQTINEQTNIFLKEHGVEQTRGEFEILNSWINFSEKGDFQYEHSHETPKYSDSECYLSGAYFYKTNNHDGDLTFISPNMIHRTELDIFTQPQAVHKPIVGKLLLFPSWLGHRVGLNTTDSQRISISFNIGLYKAYLPKDE